MHVLKRVAPCSPCLSLRCRANSPPAYLRHYVFLPKHGRRSSKKYANTDTPLSDHLQKSYDAKVQRESDTHHVIPITANDTSPSSISVSPLSRKRRKRGPQDEPNLPMISASFVGLPGKPEVTSKETEPPSQAPEPGTSNESRYDLISQLTSENWKEDWGENELAPKRERRPSRNQRRLAPHFKRTIPYTRRIEGLLEDDQDQPVLTDLPPIHSQKPIAKLSHGLDRVLFNPGVHWLQDPRSQVYNFTPWLQDIPKVTDFAFERVAGFVPSSRDEDLWFLAKQENRTFAGSTSSLTGLLSHVYFLISNDKEVDTSTLSKFFQGEPRNFTLGQRMPVSVKMNHKDGVYAIDYYDSHKLGADKNILTWLGVLLEKFLTTPSEDFRRYLRSSPPEVDAIPIREAYRYAKSGRFVMRSQLDCHDSRLPGTGVFDIKTRAAVPIRLDILNYEENSGYLIRSLHGPLESFEKEYYDLIRSAFLKYNFQARIGNMDGIFVAYHNTARLFGFQYVPLEEIDRRLFGSHEAGERVFRKCIALLEILADEIVRCFPNESVRCTCETLEDSRKLTVWVEPAEWDSDAARPIRQLEMTTTSFIDSKKVSGSRAVAKPEANWRVYWTVSWLSGDEAHIRSQLAAAKERQFWALSLPKGVSLYGMEERWNSINFSGKESDSPVPYDPDSFRKPSRNVQILRAVARAGREYTEQQALEQAGKPKIVWGEPEVLAEQDDTWEIDSSSEVLEQDATGFAADGETVVVLPVEELECQELPMGSLEGTAREDPNEPTVSDQDILGAPVGAYDSPEADELGLRCTKGDEIIPDVGASLAAFQPLDEPSEKTSSSGDMPPRTIPSENVPKSADHQRNDLQLSADDIPAGATSVETVPVGQGKDGAGFLGDDVEQPSTAVVLGTKETEQRTEVTVTPLPTPDI